MTAPSRKTLWAATGVALLALVGCGSSDTQNASNTPETSVSVASDGTVKGPEDSTFILKPGPDGQDVLATFPIKFRMNESMTSDGAELTTIKLLEFARENYPDAAQVTLKGDLDGTVLVTVTYLKATMDRFYDFNRVNHNEVWGLADSGYIDPALNP